MSDKPEEHLFRPVGDLKAENQPDGSINLSFTGRGGGVAILIDKQQADALASELFNVLLLYRILPSEVER